jgi:hypothetical protein
MWWAESPWLPSADCGAPGTSACPPAVSLTDGPPLFRTVFWELPHSLGARLCVLVWPKSFPNRALSCTEMGNAPCGGRPAYGLATVPVPWTPAWGGHTRANARAYRGRRLRVDGPAALGVAPEVVARFTEPAARGCTASRPSAAAPAARAGRCCWRRWVRDARVATEGSLSFPPLGAGGLNRSSMGT